jgi:hypothetical protein
MKKPIVLRIKLRNMRNEEWFNFYTEFKTFALKHSPENLDIEVLFAVFLSLYGKADEAMEVLRKSSFTTEIIQLDDERDNTFRGLSGSIETALHHYDPAKRAAAERLKPLFDHYGNLSAKPYNEETAGIYNLLQELRGQYAPQSAALELTGWIDELERRNQAFEAAILTRNTESAGKSTEVKLLDIRRQTDRCYLDIVERLEALMLIRGEAAFGGFVKELNANIERYNNVLSRRHAQKTDKTNNN